MPAIPTALRIPVIICMAIIWPWSAAHSAINLDVAADWLSLMPHMEVYEDKGISGVLDHCGGELTGRAFNPVGKIAPNFGFTKSVIWSRFSLVNPSDGKRVVYLRIDNARLQEIDVYVCRDGIIVDEQTGGTRYPYDHREIRLRYPIFPIQVGGGEEVTVFLRTYSETSHFLPLTLLSSNGLLISVMDEQVFYGLFYGLLIALLLYNLSLVFVVRAGSAYLSFVIYLAVAIFYSATIEGIMYRFAWPDSPWWAHRSANFIGVLTIAAAFGFVQRFLSLDKAAPSINGTVNWIAVLLFIMAALSLFIEYQIISKLTVLIGLIYPYLILWIAIAAWRRGFGPARFLVAAFAVVAAGVGAFALRLAGLLPDNFITAYAIQIGVVLEFLLLSFALSERTRLQRKRQERDASERIKAAEAVSKHNKAVLRFVPEDCLKMLSKENLSRLDLGDQTEALMTAFFMDIRPIIAIENKGHEEDYLKQVNAVFSDIVGIITKHNGILTRYVGGDMLCVFRHDVESALRAASEIISYIDTTYVTGRQEHKAGLLVSIGLNTDQMRLGLVGDSERMELTLLGDSVNTAARIRSEATRIGARILVSGNTRRMLDDPSVFHMRLVDVYQWPGHLESVALYEVFDSDTESSRRLKMASRESIERAVHLRQMRQMKESESVLVRLLKENPADEVVRQILLTRYERYWLESQR